MPEFRKPHHRIIAGVLASLNARLLADARCYFGGGTQLAMTYGIAVQRCLKLTIDEFRKSRARAKACIESLGVEDTTTLRRGVGLLHAAVR